MLNLVHYFLLLRYELVVTDQLSVFLGFLSENWVGNPFTLHVASPALEPLFPEKIYSRPHVFILNLLYHLFYLATISLLLIISVNGSTATINLFIWCSSAILVQRLLLLKVLRDRLVLKLNNVVRRHLVFPFFYLVFITSLTLIKTLLDLLDVYIKNVVIFGVVLEPPDNVLPERAVKLARVGVGVLLAIARHVILVQLHYLFVQLLVQFRRHVGVSLVKFMFHDKLPDKVGAGWHLTLSPCSNEL